MGKNLKVVWAEFSRLSLAVFVMSGIACNFVVPISFYVFQSVLFHLRSANMEGCLNPTCIALTKLITATVTVTNFCKC
jgi:hypothetical protein